MKWKALRAAFPHTLPIFAGFWFLGLAYGIYMHAAGFSFVYPMLMSLLIFGGSLEFVAVEMLLSPFAPVQVLIMTLLIQARHLFYGISMLDKYKGMGWKKGYLIFGMCDETFSINCSVEPPEGMDKGWFQLFITILNCLYWVGGALLGSIAGAFLPFDTTGIDFAMTALFVVIYLNQWMEAKDHRPALIGLGATLLCLIVFGADNFILPAMALILLCLTLLRKKLEPAPKGGKKA